MSIDNGRRAGEDDVVVRVDKEKFQPTPLLLRLLGEQGVKHRPGGDLRVEEDWYLATSDLGSREAETVVLNPETGEKDYLDC